MIIEELDYEDLVKRVKASKSQAELQSILQSVQQKINGPILLNSTRTIDIYMANRKVTIKVVEILNQLGCDIKKTDYIRII